MTSETESCLGILGLEPGLPAGVTPPSGSAFVTAARRLVERGAVVITSDCGSAVRYQAAVAAAVSVPVAMSSLLLVPALLRQLPPKSQTRCCHS